MKRLLSRIVCLMLGLSLWCGVATAAVADDKVKFSDLSMLVTSCDKYAELWPPFFHFLYKSWPSLKEYNQDMPIYLISNQVQYNDSRVHNIMIHDEQSWSDNILTALEFVKTKYVMIVLEDYIFYGDVKESRLNKVFQLLKDQDGAYIQISCNDLRYQDGIEGTAVTDVVLRPRFGLYRTSLQLCIWNVEHLRWLLKPGETPWEFELAGSTRSDGMMSPFYTIRANEPISYYNAAQQGLLNDHVIAYMNDAGFDFTPQRLDVQSNHKLKLWFLGFRSKVYHKWFLPAWQFIST